MTAETRRRSIKAAHQLAWDTIEDTRSAASNYGVCKRTSAAYLHGDAGESQLIEFEAALRLVR